MLLAESPPGSPPWAAYFPLTTVLLVLVLSVFRLDALQEAALDLKALLGTKSDTVMYASLSAAFVGAAALVRVGSLAYHHFAAKSKRAQTEKASLIKERMALRAIYESLGGSGWKKSTKWLTNAPLHEWHGVSLDHASQHVTKLILQENNLTGVLPAAIGDLTWLSELDLRDNLLSGAIPPALCSLRGMRGLYLYGNRLQGPIPDDLVRLAPTLQGIYLFNNEFEDIERTKALFADSLHPDCIVII